MATGRRAAKLTKARDLVRGAELVTNDTAAVRIEAQPKAGELLRAMAERGERDSGRRGRIGSRPATQLGDLGVTKSESSRCQQVASVLPAVRAEHVEESEASGGEVSTDGLMRHARGARYRLHATPHVATPPEPRVPRVQTTTDAPTTSPPASLDYHPAANLFPLLEVESPEFGELMDDIREHGLQQPIVLHEGRILDGRNRYRACQHAAIEPRFVEWDGESPTAYVLSLNLHRRHLTEGQLAAIAVEAKERFEAEAREAQRQAGEHGREGGRGKRKTLRVESHEGFPERDHAAEWARRPLARAAAETGVASNRVRVAEGVKKADPKLFEKVHAGTVPLRGAVKEVEQREGRPGRRAKPRAATVPEPDDTEPPSPRQPQAAAPEAPEVHAPAVEQTNGAGRDGETADRTDRPSFEAIENSDQVQQREQFARLCTALVALPLPTQFIARHDGKLAPDHIESARAAHQWLTAFVTNLEPEPEPQPPVTWTLDGFLHHLVQVNTLMERHGDEIVELLANRISPGPDIAIVRAALAHLGELDRRFGVLECGAGRG